MRETNSMWRCLLLSGFGVIFGAARFASATQIIAVDYDGTAGDIPSTTPVTQPGFTAVTSASSTPLPGGYAVSETPINSGGSSGFFTRAGVTNNPPAFTEAALYEDFFYSQNNTFAGNPSAIIEVTGLRPNTPYTFTFYTYDASDTIRTSPHTTSFTGTGNTTGTGTVASYIAGQNPTANEQYTSTGTYTSTTGAIDINAAITSNNDFLRINGFTVSTVPEPASLSLLGLSAVGLLARRRNV